MAGRGPKIGERAYARSPIFGYSLSFREVLIMLVAKMVVERRTLMSGPIVFISHFKVKEGKLEGLKEHAQKIVELIRAEKPGTLAFLQYLNEDETELSIVHVFTDADALDKHNEGVAERARGAFEFLEPISRELYGMPSEKTLSMMTGVRPPGAPEIEAHHMPKDMGGYIRFKAE
jgi:quinol monooxygenase YgiN